MKNLELRQMLKKDDIYLWQLADALGIHETTLVKRLRKELNDSQKKEVIAAIERINLKRCEERNKLIEKELARIGGQTFAEAFNSIRVEKPVHDPSETLDDTIAF